MNYKREKSGTDHQNFYILLKMAQNTRKNDRKCVASCWLSDGSYFCQVSRFLGMLIYVPPGNNFF